MGHSNDEVYRELLGYSDDDEVARLQKEGSYEHARNDPRRRPARRAADRRPDPAGGESRALEAIVATGVHRGRGHRFRLPSKVPALADAAELAVELKRFGDVAFSALVASAGGASRALAAGLVD